MRVDDIREPVVAGSFYPAEPDVLRQDIQRYLDAAKPPVAPEHVIGLISPHAGYQYSGGTAAFGYKLLQGKTYKRVIVFALSHRADFRGASVFPGKGFKTPLGVVPVDTEVVKKLHEASPFITHNLLAEQMEHSLEVQVPFLQCVLKDFLLIPVLIRDQDLSTCQKIVDLLLKVLPGDARRDTLVVGSTDLYHGSSYKECVRMDTRLADTLILFDEERFEDEMARDEIMACGPASIMSTTLLSRAFGAQKISLLHLTNSQDVTGYRSDYVVGYLSAVLY